MASLRKTLGVEVSVLEASVLEALMLASAQEVEMQEPSMLLVLNFPAVARLAVILALKLHLMLLVPPRSDQT